MTSHSFRPDRLAALAAVEDEHPWFVARRAMIRGLVDRVRPPGACTVLDVGCGTGRTLRAVARKGDEAIGVDLLADQSHRAASSAELLEADIRHLPIETGAADVVLALDVLEHVEEHDVAVSELARVTRRGGHVVVTVPAHRWLWSFRDVDAGHVRRYGRAAIVELVSGAGLRVEQVSWFAGSTLPVLALLRLLGRWAPRFRDLEERPRRGCDAEGLRRVLEAEARSVVAGGGPVIGSSLVVVARLP